MTFDQWYFSKVGVTVGGARERGVYDIGLMEQCWEAAVKQAREDAIEEAKQACVNQLGGLSMFVTDRECVANNTAVRECYAAIESLKGKA